MESYISSREIFPHVSVDCVIFGFDGHSLKVLLMDMLNKETKGSYNDFKFPGSILYMDEDLDAAAQRAINEIAGFKNIQLRQFKSFGSPNRVSRHINETHWLERITRHKIGRIVTVGYLALIKMNQKISKISKEYDVKWVDVKTNSIKLAFDHRQILDEAMKEIRQQITFNRSIIFDLLPKKFTVRQLRSAYEVIYDRPYDVRNFYKKYIENEKYIIPLDEYEKNVTHRAARFFRFDRKAFSKKHDSLS
ncbi:MAG: NUDIX hydrolase [Prevotellaceae bacterium]|jgi:ADP-ribose pyrophosphatase YjhB (NUDIX family)|nr:NUDIX hydrolase [Prevotellaceae bacterium]